MRRIFWGGFVLLCCLAGGCVRPPEIREDVITTTDVILNIKCELRDALRRMRPHSAWMTKSDASWEAGFTVTLRVVAKGDLTGDASFVVPLSPGTFTVALTAGVSSEATRTETIDFTENLHRLLNFDLCPSDVAADRRDILLEGRLGFADLVARAIASRQMADIKPTSLSYNLNFDIKKNGSVSPKFSLIPIGGSRTFGGGVSLVGTQTDTDSLKVVFTAPVVKVCKFTEVKGVCPLLVYMDPSVKALSGLPGEGSRQVDQGATQQRIEMLKGRNVLEDTLNELRGKDVLVDE